MPDTASASGVPGEAAALVETLLMQIPLLEGDNRFIALFRKAAAAIERESSARVAAEARAATLQERIDSMREDALEVRERGDMT